MSVSVILQTNEPLPFAPSVAVATTESLRKPSPCFQHFTVALLKPGAAMAILVCWRARRKS